MTVAYPLRFLISHTKQFQWFVVFETYVRSCLNFVEAADKLAESTLWTYLKTIWGCIWLNVNYFKQVIWQLLKAYLYASNGTKTPFDFKHWIRDVFECINEWHFRVWIVSFWDVAWHKFSNIVHITSLVRHCIVHAIKKLFAQTVEVRMLFGGLIGWIFRFQLWLHSCNPLPAYLEPKGP